MRFVSFNITCALEIVVTSVSGGVEFLTYKFGHGSQLELLVATVTKLTESEQHTCG